MGGGGNVLLFKILIIYFMWIDFYGTFSSCISVNILNKIILLKNVHDNDYEMCPDFNLTATKKIRYYR